MSWTQLKTPGNPVFKTSGRYTRSLVHGEVLNIHTDTIDGLKIVNDQYQNINDFFFHSKKGHFLPTS